MNKYKKKEEESSAPDLKVARKLIGFFDFGNVLSREQIVSMIPFVLFLTVLAILYISNTYYAEKTIVRINKITNELKELRSEYITAKSELMFRSKQSEVARAVGPMGIKESVVPPVKIIVKKENALAED